MPQYLAYGFAESECLWHLDGFDLRVVPQGSGVSFLDFEGVVLLAGEFASLPPPGSPMSALVDHPRRAVNPADLARRDREATTLLQAGKPVLFLVPRLARPFLTAFSGEPPDLFPRLLDRCSIEWSVASPSIAVDTCLVAEFKQYCDKFGQVSVTYRAKGGARATTIASARDEIAALEADRSLFLLPCYSPTDIHNGLDMAEAGVSAVITYRNRGDVVSGQSAGRETGRTREIGKPGSTIEKLIAGGESATVEFKETARWDVRGGTSERFIEDIIVKTIAAMLNTDGGTLVIGVSDAGQVSGLERDYATLGQRPNKDGFEQWLMSRLNTDFGRHVTPTLRIEFATIDGKEVCSIHVPAASGAVFVTKDGQEKFYVRTGNATNELKPSEMTSYMQNRSSAR